MSNWILNQKMRTKLLGGFGLLALIALLLAGQGMRGTRSVHREATAIAAHAEGAMALKESNVALLRLSRAVRNAILDTTAADVERRIADIRRYEADFYAKTAQFDSTIVVEASRARLRALVDGFRDLRPRQDSVVALALEGRDRDAQRRLGDIRERANVLEAQMDTLEATKRELVAGAIQGADSTYASTMAWSIGLALASLAIAALIAVTLTGMITRSLARVQQAVQRAASGDLTVQVQVDSADELGQTGDAVNQLLSSLRTSLTVVSQNSAAVASASQQLTAAALEISSGAQEQASSLEETAASLEEMTATVKQNADNAQQANQLAVGARDVAERGGQVVAETVRAMGEINASSRKIADIITTIDEIAFQTNLLALNAAVEAARAGAQGRGFAVVAGEVRSLAQRSATAAKEIKSLIQDSVAKVDSGADLVNRSGVTLKEIMGAVKRVTDIVAEIAAASKEQATGIDQVNKAVTQMDTVTQANAGQTEELSGTAEALAQQAQELQAQVARFELGSGQAGVRHASPKAAARPVSRRPAPVAARPAAPRLGKANGNGNGMRHGNGNGNGHAPAPLGGRLATLEPDRDAPPVLPDLDEGFEEY